MISPNDVYSLRRLMRLRDGAEIPENVLMECELRTRMFHSDGQSGPLGTVGLIDALRYLGVAPVNAEAESVAAIDWRNFPQDGSVRVEAYFFGAWMPGVFLGFVESGTLAIRLDLDDTVRECRRDIVRLEVESFNPKIYQEIREDSDARADLIEAAHAATDFTDQDTEEEIVVEPAQPKVIDLDLSAIEIGTGLWIAIDGDVVDAEFISVEDDKVCVLIDGKEATVGREQIRNIEV